MNYGIWRGYSSVWVTTIAIGAVGTALTRFEAHEMYNNFFYLECFFFFYLSLCLVSPVKSPGPNRCDLTRSGLVCAYEFHDANNIGLFALFLIILVVVLCKDSILSMWFVLVVLSDGGNVVGLVPPPRPPRSQGSPREPCHRGSGICRRPHPKNPGINQLPLVPWLSVFYSGAGSVLAYATRL